MCVYLLWWCLQTRSMMISIHTKITSYSGRLLVKYTGHWLTRLNKIMNRFNWTLLVSTNLEVNGAYRLGSGDLKYNVSVLMHSNLYIPISHSDNEYLDFKLSKNNSPLIVASGLGRWLDIWIFPDLDSPSLNCGPWLIPFLQLVGIQSPSNV